MKTDNIKLTKELVELKYSLLIQRIDRIYNLLKTLSVVIDLDSEIKSIEIILYQYKKMYKQVLQTGEYQKYEEIEDAILEKLAKIEFKMDKQIYKTSKDVQSIFSSIFSAIENGKNCRAFRDLDKEIEKIKWLKELAKQYTPFIGKDEIIDINEQISRFKFELLIKRQLEQMIYENGGKSSSLNRFDSEAERTFFESLLEQLIFKLEDDDEIKQSYSARQIMEDNLLLTHVVFKIYEQKIVANAKQFIELLNVPIFNPHLCNIANNPYKKKIPYAEQKLDDYRYYTYFVRDYSGTRKLERNKINLSLLVAVLEGIIDDKNTTIMECDKIYNRFGFKSRPITINEGQELIRRIYNRFGFKSRPITINEGQELIRRIYNKVGPLTTSNKSSKTEKSNQQLCRLRFTPLNYDFEPIDEQFFTNAQILKGLQNEEAERATVFFEEIMKLMGKDNLTRTEQERMAIRRTWELERITKISNDWVRKPLEGLHGMLTLTPVPTTYERRVVSSKHTFNRGTEYKYATRTVRDFEPLWRSYKSDLYGLDIDVKRIFNDICINLDDIADLPIDFRKTEILTSEELKKAKKGYEEER